MELVKSLNNDNRPVFVLDDGVLLSGSTFSFESIAEVASSCMPLIEQIANRCAGKYKSSIEIILAGVYVDIYTQFHHTTESFFHI